MKQVIILIAIVLIALSSCEDNANQSNQLNQDSTSLANEWKLLRIESIVDGPTKTKPTDEDRDVVMSISNRQMNVFNFVGQTPGNQFNGRFVILEDNTLRIEEFAPTEALDTEWGRTFIESVEQVNAYAFWQGHLEWYTNSEKLVFQKE